MISLESQEKIKIEMLKAQIDHICSANRRKTQTIQTIQTIQIIQIIQIILFPVFFLLGPRRVGGSGVDRISDFRSIR